MKQKGLRLLSSLLAAIMTIGLLPVQAANGESPAAEANPTLPVADVVDGQPTSGIFDGFLWTLDTNDPSNYILHIYGDGDLPDYAFGEQRPWEPWRVDTVLLSGNITAIGDYLFEGYGSIKSIRLPSTLTRIGTRALEGVSITGVAIPYGVTEIGDYAFYGTDLRWADLPDTVTRIGSHAFANTDLSAVVIPDSVEELGASMFQSCSRLQSVVLPTNITAIPDAFFKNSGLRHYDIPAHIASIGSGAFYGTGLTEIYIPPTVTALGEEAFAAIDTLTQVTVAGTLDVLPEKCFYNCENLTWVDIQSEITEIGYYCFAFSPVEVLLLPSSLTFIDTNGFFALRGVFARGPGVNAERDNNYLFSHKYNSLPGTPTIFYIPGQEGWSGLQGENCSDTLWYGYPLATWDGVHAELPDDSMNSYYATPEKKFFCMQVPGASYPSPTGFEIRIGADVYHTGSSDRITIPVPKDYTGNIVFSKEGYLTYEMPAELAGTFNWITMWPDDGGTTPVIQAIYIDNSGGSYKGFGNLRTRDQTIYALDSASRRFYVSVLWRDGEEGVISMMQNGKEIIQLENHGWTTFQPGMQLKAGDPVYLQAKNSQSKTAAALKLQVRTPAKDLDVDLGSSVSGSTGSGCAAMQNQKLELEINGGALPMTIKVEDNKIIGIIGVTLDAGNTESAFNKAKELVDKADAGMGDDIFSQFANLYRGMTGPKASDLWPKRQGSMAIKTEVQFLGYFEAGLRADENGKIDMDFGMSKLAMKMSGGATYTQQAVVIGIPLYCQLELEAMLQTAFQLYQEAGLDDAKLPEMHMNAELSLTGALAAGIVDVVAAGVKAKGAFEAQTRLPIDPEDMTLKLTGEVAAFVTLVGLTGETILLDGEYVFYENGVWYPDSRLRTFSLRTLDQGMELHKVSRDYLEYGPAFTANAGSKLRSIVPETGNVTAKKIMANNYPYADPQLITLPTGGQVLVWLEDDGTAHQGTVLQYSYYNGKTWTTPAPAAANGTSDFEPQLRLVHNTLYLLWLDTEQPIPADCTDVAAISALLDVSMSVFDLSTQTFGQAVTFGQSGRMDILPDITVYRDQSVVVWVSSRDHLLSMETCDLWLACPEEDGWQQQELYSGLSDVDSLCAETLHGALQIRFSQSAGDSTDPQSKELYGLRCLLKNGQFVQIGDLTRYTDNDCADTDPVILHGLCYWVQDAQLVNTAGLRLDIPGSGGSYQIIDDGNGRCAVIYGVMQPEDTVDFYTVINDGSGWGAPVRAASSTGWVTGWSAQFDSKGNLTIAAAEQTGDTADLSVYTIAPKKDLAVNTAYIDGYTLVPGKDLVVFAEVENTGLTEVSSYTLTGKLDGRSAGSYKGGLLAPGEKEMVRFTCTIPESGAAELTLSLGSDTNRDNNTQTLTLANQDLSVEGVHLSLDFTGHGEASVSVINRGMTDSGTATLVCKKAIPGQTADKWETVSAPMDIESLSPQDMMTYTLPLTNAAAQGDLIYAVLETEDEDHLMENNSDFAVVALPAAGRLDFEPSCILSFDDGKAHIQLSADNGTDQKATGLIYVAAYDHGRMTDLRTFMLSAAPGECLLEQLTLDCLPDGEIYMFVLDPESYTPLYNAMLPEAKN